VLIPVDRLEQVTAARCLSCLSCVDACPQKESKPIAWGPPRVLGGRWSQAALVAILLACTTGAVAASYVFPMPSFVKTHGTRPEQVAQVKLEISGLSCRGRANLLFYGSSESSVRGREEPRPTGLRRAPPSDEPR